MEYHPQDKHEEHSTPSYSNHWLVVLVIVLLASVGISLGYTLTQHRALNDLQTKNQDLTSNNQQLGATVTQMDATVSQLRGQVDALNSKLAAMSEPGPASGSAAVRRARAVSSLRRLQVRLRAQQSQLDQVKTQVAQQRSDLENELGSTRDTLNGGIARNHTELVALEKRGERNYYEFDLMKTKRFQRFGPVLLSLRKADTKHQHFNMMLLVDDNQLTKKNVNLYEPVWIYRADDPQPTQVVVNKIAKNYVHGYVSAPKYSKAELAAAAQQQPSSEVVPADVTPASNGQTPAASPSQPPAAQNPIPQ
jgi:cell division protein FtsB